MTNKKDPEWFGKLKPSEAIDVALKDLEKCERDERYAIDMGHWHEGREHHDGRYDDSPLPDEAECVVCLSGSVMAKSLNVTITEQVCPANFDWRTCGVLTALNDWRMGFIHEGMVNADIKGRNKMPMFMTVTPYDVSPEAFKRNMRAIRDRFAARGM